MSAGCGNAVPGMGTSVGSGLWGALKNHPRISPPQGAGMEGADLSLPKGAGLGVGAGWWCWGEVLLGLMLEFKSGLRGGEVPGGSSRLLGTGPHPSGFWRSPRGTA